MGVRNGGIEGWSKKEITGFSPRLAKRRVNCTEVGEGWRAAPLSSSADAVVGSMTHTRTERVVFGGSTR